MSDCQADQCGAEHSFSSTINPPSFKIRMGEVGQLDSWPSKNNRMNTEDFFRAAVNSPLPPWRAVPSRSAAKLLGVTLQTMANWRVRGVGPSPEPMRKGYGNRIYYRPDAILEWLSSGGIASWTVAKAWLQKWMGVEADLSEEEVIGCAADLDGMGMFPEVRDLWRTFQNRM